jgi:hypothetical protein
LIPYRLQFDVFQFFDSFGLVNGKKMDNSFAARFLHYEYGFNGNKKPAEKAGFLGIGPGY